MVQTASLFLFLFFSFFFHYEHKNLTYCEWLARQDPVWLTPWSQFSGVFFYVTRQNFKTGQLDSVQATAQNQQKHRNKAS